jgi:hypothetical protein
MCSGADRRWCPPQSPVRVEFSSDLLIEVWGPEEAIEKTGDLFGLRNDREISVLATRPEHAEAPEKVGIFVSRARGEVFLTESNLGLFQKEQAVVALVVAGDKAGFFVRELDGSIQSVRSHEEFSVSRPVPIGSSHWRWVWPAAGGLVALALLLPAFPKRPLHSPTLRVSEEQEQLHIGWKPGQQAVLEIVDGGDRIAIPVSPDQSSATYARRTATVEISLIALDGKPARPQTQRFEAPPAQFVDPRAQLDRLQAEVDAKRARATSLQKAIGRLLSERAIQQQ